MNDTIKWAVAALTSIALALGGWSLTGVSSLQVSNAKTETRVDGLEKKLDRIEWKLDKVLEKR